MSNEADRVAKLAKESFAHLENLSTEIDRAGPPCWTCQYGARDTSCRHPLVRRGNFNSVTGKTSWYDGDQASLRRETEACGERARLYERASRFMIAWRTVHGGWWMLFPIFLLVELISIIYA